MPASRIAGSTAFVATIEGVITITATGDDAPGSWRRLVGQMLRAFAAPGAPLPPMPDAPGSPALYRAMARFGQPSSNEL